MSIIPRTRLDHAINESTYLLHVGHSSFDGGFPFGQFFAWHGVDPAALMVDPAI
jgi:hypothetical protein